MNSKAHRSDTVLRIACAVATSVGTGLFLLTFVGLCFEAVRHHEFRSHELGLPIALGIIGLLTFFCAYIAWRLWRGSLSSNGVTFMPSWFIRTFGIFFFTGITFVSFHHPSFPIFVESFSIALAMIYFDRRLAKRKKEFNHEAQPCAAANPACASRLQSLRPERRIAELGSLDHFERAP